ncbi:replication protein A 70 kDa DNA-binding subunit B-like [Lactuca sativa]|uniref:replication protein A 70 kDa DNA-binding subunit B-like n=1 Tax=Lactuca sativa TaxID=4236 RepID=UPI000CD81986|nr:replication protein A 70 kDa DNA-binding subunit B-like [Lactuca sativa]
MTRDYYNIVDITPNMKKSWTIEIQVVECGHRQLSNAKKEFRRLMFADTQGTRVSALVYSNDLDFFENTFKPYNRYQISNANLRLMEPRFQLDSYEFSWTLSRQTLIEPIEEQTPPPLSCQFHFTPFSELYKYADEENYLNVRGVVIKCLPIQHVKKGSKTSSKRDVIIVNEEKKLLILTLWNPIDEIEGNALDKITNTGLYWALVFAMRVKVTTFYGIFESLSNIIYTINKAEIKVLLQNETYKDTEILLPPPENKDILPIGRAIIRMKNGKPTWIKGNLNLLQQDRSFTQTICAMCLKPIQADVNWNIKYPLCKEKSEVQIISRAIIEINDGTRTIAASISTLEIEKLIPLNPSEIRDVAESEKNVHDVIASSVRGLSVVTFVRSYQSWNQQQQITRFVIVKLHKVQEHYTKEQQLLIPSTKSENLSTTKPASPKQTQKQPQPDVGKTKVIE